MTQNLVIDLSRYDSKTYSQDSFPIDETYSIQLHLLSEGSKHFQSLTPANDDSFIQEEILSMPQTTISYSISENNNYSSYQSESLEQKLISQNNLFNPNYNFMISTYNIGNPHLGINGNRYHYQRTRNKY